MTGPVRAKTPSSAGASASGDSVELSDSARSAATADVPQATRIDLLA